MPVIDSQGFPTLDTYSNVWWKPLSKNEFSKVTFLISCLQNLFRKEMPHNADLIALLDTLPYACSKWMLTLRN